MIIIPDIHGRTFWKSAVKGRETEEIVFLGDYVDPYSELEGLEPLNGFIALSEIVEFKKLHPDNVTLLLGNHDLSYLSDQIAKCRHDFGHHGIIRKTLQDNLSLFHIAYEKSIGGKLYIFTHAGILPNWLKNNEMTLGCVKPGHEVEVLNRAFAAGNLYTALRDCSHYRGGSQENGSCVWADVDEHFDAGNSPDAVIYSDIYQVFGHTLQLSGRPIITPHFACLDCQKAFNLNEEGLALLK